MSHKNGRSDGDDDKEHGGRDSFFQCLDRVPSGLHIDADFPSDDDDDDEDDVRVSFASAVGGRSFLEYQVALDDDDDDDGDQVAEAEDPSKYDMWMAAEPMSIQERRRRLHQGMGLASSRDLVLRRHSTRKRASEIPRCSSRLQLPPLPAAPAVTADAPSIAVPTPPPVVVVPLDILKQPPAKAITRRRSDSYLAIRDGVLGKAKQLLPSLRRAGSLQPLHAVVDGSPVLPAESVVPRDAPAPAPQAAVPKKDKVGNGKGEGDDGDDAGECRIKNLEDCKELAVADVSKDGAATNVLSDRQTGVQLGLEEFEKFLGHTPIVKHLMRRGQSQSASAAAAEPKGGAKPAGKKKGGWLKNIKSVAIGLIHDKDGNGAKSSSACAMAISKSASTNAGPAAPSSSSSSERLKVHHYGKSCKELSGLYMCQEIRAHEGSIWTIRFSTGGRQLASAGEDRVVRVWQVVETSTPPSALAQDGSGLLRQPPPPDGSAAPAPGLAQLSKRSVRGKSCKDALPEHVVMPEKVFALGERPVGAFEGHLDDVLDLSWSKSDQHLLSSSMDKTVRLWDMDTKACLKMFAHNDYVTCVQFSPVEEGRFMSGSLDAKVRMWSIPDRQVIDWTDLNEMVTATSYTPDGQGAIIGSHKGSCRFYNTTDCKLSQSAQIDIQTKKRKSQAKKITGFQFAPGNPSEVLVTSADSQIRVFDGVTMVQKFRGFKNTSSQISATYTADGRYVVCASEDSHVYLWKTARSSPAAAAIAIGMKAKTWCTTRSFENFFCKDVSAAVPWPLSPSCNDNNNVAGGEPPPSCNDEACSTSSHAKPEARSGELTHSGQLASSSETTGQQSWRQGGGKGGGNGGADGGNAWGLVVVTASLGGEIRVYQNFGMPLRIRGQSNLFY